MTSKVRSETQTLVGDENMNSFCSTRARVEADDGQSSSAMEDLLQWSFICILESIATRVVKKGVLYTNPFTQKPVLLLGNRGLFFSNKTRINAAETGLEKLWKELLNCRISFSLRDAQSKQYLIRRMMGMLLMGLWMMLAVMGAIENLHILRNGNCLLAILLQLLRYWIQFLKIKLRISFGLLSTFPTWH